MQLLSLGQILNLSEISDKISKVDISKFQLLKIKFQTLKIFSQKKIKNADKGDLIIDSVRQMTEEEIDAIYLLGLNKDMRWDLLAKRLIKNNMFYLENNYFYHDRINLIVFIFKMWASNYKKDFMSFIKSDSILFSFKAFKYTVREILAFALGTVNSDMKISRKMRSEAMGVSLNYVKGLHYAKNNFSKEDISSIISNFSDTKHYDVAAYIAENFEIDETTSMLANEHCSHILRKNTQKEVSIMENFIWLDQPIHKNRIKFELENKEDFNFSFDGSIVSFSPKIIDENKEMFQDIQNSKLGYKN